MTLDLHHNLEIINIMENYLEKTRPEESIRDQLDIGYKIDGQSIIILEIRPDWDNPSKTMDLHYAKTTYIKKSDKWKLFWMKSDLKWHGYTPNLYSKNLKKILEIIDIDEYACFKG